MEHRRNLVSAEWLAPRTYDPSMVVVDCRFDLAKPGAGRAEYERAHIPGASHLDLERDLSGRKAAHGGRHPLPDIGAFSDALARIGVDERVTVVAYDDQGGCMAARLWWMLRYLGHDGARVLDGGWSAWRQAGLPTTDELPRRARGHFTPSPRLEALTDLEGLREHLSLKDVCLIDSRAPERFRGDVEPLDPVAGHIPGAVNLAWTENNDAGGTLKGSDELRRRFAAVRESGQRPVVYCGSGVTACVNLMAMDEAGIADAVLYLGGWSDWCSYPENPVAAKE